MLEKLQLELDRFRFNSFDGSLEPDLLFELAAKNNVTLPSSDDPAFASAQSLSDRYGRFTSLDDFLHYYFIGMTVLVTAEDFERLAYAYFSKAHTQNVQHAEIFFDPQVHTGRGVSYYTLLEGLKSAQARAQTDFGLTSELIVCMIRNQSIGDCHQAFLTALPDLINGKIRGLGLSGTEINKPPSNYKVSYNHARSQGIKHLTAHAGEEADVSYMASAVRDLGCIRIDHGIKLVHGDPDLIKFFVDNKIMITMCPISNKELKCVQNISELPIRKYLDLGVRFNINSDDPAYFAGGTYIQENYCAVQEAFDLTAEEWSRIARWSIEGSWCEGKRKTELLGVLDEFCLKQQVK